MSRVVNEKNLFPQEILRQINPFHYVKCPFNEKLLVFFFNLILKQYQNNEQSLLNNTFHKLSFRYIVRDKIKYIKC